MGVGIRAVEAGPEKDGRWGVAATEVATVAEAIQQAIQGRIRYGKDIMYVWGVIKDMLKCDVVVVVVDILERGGEGRGRRAEGGGQREERNRPSVASGGGPSRRGRTI